MYVIETRIKTRSNKTIWMPYKQYRTTNGIENFQKRHQYLFDAGELRRPMFASPDENGTAVNAAEGAGGEQARIHSVEALHRLGRF